VWGRPAAGSGTRTKKYFFRQLIVADKAILLHFKSLKTDICKDCYDLLNYLNRFY